MIFILDAQPDGKGIKQHFPTKDIKIRIDYLIIKLTTRYKKCNHHLS